MSQTSSARIQNLGDTYARSIGYDGTKARIAIPQLDLNATGDTFATVDATQTLTNKTLTTPVIASLQQSASGGTISMPTVASGSTATLATTADITSAISGIDNSNLVDVATAMYEQSRMDRLLNYLEGWIGVGDLNMNDICSVVDYAGKSFACLFRNVNGVVSMEVKEYPNDCEITSITAIKEAGAERSAVAYTTNDETYTFTPTATEIGNYVSGSDIRITFDDNTYVDVPIDKVLFNGWCVYADPLSE